MSEAIKLYDVDTQESLKLQTVSNLLNLFDKTDNFYYIDDIYFDHGQDWKWTTIVVAKNGNFSDSYQLLCPRDHELIINSLTLNNLVDITKTLLEQINKRGW
jgi:hypothetical protein